MRNTQPRTDWILALVAIVVIACAVDLSAAVSITSDVKADTDWYGSFTTRVLGSAGHKQANSELLEKIRAIPNVQVWTHEFSVVMPITETATLSVSSGKWQGEYAVYPYYPSSVRLNTTPIEGIEGKLIYVGGGLPSDIPAKDIRGQIAVMDLKAEDRSNWMTIANFGARAIVVLGHPREDRLDAVENIQWYPLELPRYYIPDGPLADALRNGAIEEGKLFCKAKWESVTATNIYALAKPVEPSISRQAIGIGVPIDSMGALPDLCPGGETAIDAAFALNMLRHFGENPPDRPFLFTFIDAYGINMRGMREMLGALSVTEAEKKKNLSDDKKLAEKYKKIVRLAEELEKEPNVIDSFHKDKYRKIHDYLKDEVALKVVEIDTVMHPKRIAAFSATKQEKKRLKNEVAILAAKRGEYFGIQKNMLGEEALEDELVALDGKITSANRIEKANLLWASAKGRIIGQFRETEQRLEISRQRDKLRADILDAMDASLLSLLDIDDLKWSEFCSQLVKAGEKDKSSISKRIWELLPAEIRKVVNTVAEKKIVVFNVDKDLRGGEVARRLKIVQALNEIIDNPDFYDDASFEGIGISDETKQLIEKGTAALTPSQVRKLNRALLEGAYKKEIAKTPDKPIGFYIGIDLSDSGISVGPLVIGWYLYNKEVTNSEQFFDWLEGVHQEEKDTVWTADEQKVLNLEALGGTDAHNSHVMGYYPSFTAMAMSFGTPSVTWATLDAFRPRLETAYDRADMIEWKNLMPQIGATFSLLERLAHDFEFKPVCEVEPRWTRVEGIVVDQAPGEPLPRLPLKDYLVTLIPGATNTAGIGTIAFWDGIVGGVRRLEFLRSGSDGKFYFDLYPSHVNSDRFYKFFMQAYLLREDGSIERAVDMRKTGKGVTLNTDMWVRDPTPLRAVMFTCRQFSLYGLYDTRFLWPLSDTTILDARRGTIPQRLNYSLLGGVLTCLLEPGVDWQVILRTGITANRMGLFNMGDPEKTLGMSARKAMTGFPLGEDIPAHPYHIGASDFYKLDKRRLMKYREAGITSEAIEEIQTRTAYLLEEADQSIENNDGRALFNSISGAMSSEVRAYKAIRNMAKDVIRAAIFLLLGLVPFSYALERLLFGSPHVYRQIISTLIIFGIMSFILWMFHPAFRISPQPLIIIMAFAIIFMSLLVISMVFFKFKTNMEELRSGRAETSGARTSRLGLVSTALRLGIANMRKRKLRTLLTGITIMLITFSLLCFMSTSRYVGKKEFSLDAKSPYTGVLIRQPASRVMSSRAPLFIRNVIDEDTFDIAFRYWWMNPSDRQWKVHLRNPETGIQISVDAALGLSSAESKASKIDKVLHNWDRFAEGNVCYIAKKTAEDLGVEPGDKIFVAGEMKELIGVFDAKEFDAQIKCLDGNSLLPLDYHSQGGAQGTATIEGDWDLQLLASEMASGEGMETNTDLPHLSSASVVIVPYEEIRGITKLSALRSVAVVAKSTEEAKDLASELITRFAFPIYYGSPDEVHVVATTPLLPQAPKSLIIPMLIAGFIIFNTMLSSIAERKREIYIYTSLGLAPLHVGVLFLAEAITYGLMGSIFGYIIGQGVATLFSKLGWMGSITLNYSGTQAILTMAIVLAIVIISSLIPAYLAGKLATPSNDMKWKVPEPKQGKIRDTLPFTVTGRTAGGVIAFLLDYFDAHREGGIGNFSTDNLDTFMTCMTGGDDSEPILGMRGTIWLAPYDLGVRQDVRITIEPTDQEDVLGIEIELTRESGQTSNWRKLNRVFLGDLRRQLLGWRQLKAKRILQYIAQATEMTSTTQLTEG